MHPCELLKETEARRLALTGFGTSTDCPFCEEANDPSYALRFLGREWGAPDRILWRGSEVFAVPGYAPLVYPYALIVTKRHITCMADMTASERNETLEALGFLSRTLFSDGHGLDVFEHGECKGRSSSACIEHCHLHVVSGRLSLYDHLSRDFFTTPAAVSKDSCFATGESYLFAGRHTSEGQVVGLVATGTFGESQYFRKVLARMTEQSQWNWREGMNSEMMKCAFSAVATHGRREDADAHPF